MKIAITGGTGFIGRNIARTLAGKGPEVIILARGHDKTDPAIRCLKNSVFLETSLNDIGQLSTVLEGCEAIVHCAGVNRSIGKETFQKVHVDGTRNLIDAAKLVRMRKMVLISFLRARPDCESDYHQTKWEAEKLVRNSGLDHTILKCGVIYGKGDHMLDHLSHAFHTFPVFGFVGFQERKIRPVAVADLVRIVEAAVIDEIICNKTLSVTGPEELTLRQAVRRVASVANRSPIMFPLPVWFHHLLAYAVERMMVVPMVSTAQIRMLTEDLGTPQIPTDPIPSDLKPRIKFSNEQIRDGLSAAKPFGLNDLICWKKVTKAVTR